MFNQYDAQGKKMTKAQQHGSETELAPSSFSRIYAKRIFNDQPVQTDLGIVKLISNLEQRLDSALPIWCQRMQPPLAQSRKIIRGLINTEVLCSEQSQLDPSVNVSPLRAIMLDKVKKDLSTAASSKQATTSPLHGILLMKMTNASGRKHSNSPDKDTESTKNSVTSCRLL